MKHIKRKRVTMACLAMVAGAGLVLSGCSGGTGGLLPPGSDSAATILSRRPLAPTDKTLFSPGTYPDTPPLVPAPARDRSEAEVRALVQAYLQEELTGNPTKFTAYLNKFSDPAIMAKIPNPSLRAAFIGTVNTIAEPVIDYIMQAQTPQGLPLFKEIKFGVLPAGPTATAQVVDAGQGQLSILFAERLRGENPFLLTEEASHEPLHSDLSVSGDEEAIANSLDAVVYMQQLVRHPELAQEGTHKARTVNTQTLARLNTGEGARLGLFKSNGNGPVLPGSPTRPQTNFYEFVKETPGISTPGNAYLQAVLERLSNGSVPGNPNFDQATLQFIDENSNALSAEQLVAVARVLKLNINS